jgi:hypothetical protein
VRDRLVTLILGSHQPDVAEAPSDPEEQAA